MTAAPNRVAVISGGAGGLGRALAHALQTEGWSVALVDRDITGLDESATQKLYCCDLTASDQLTETCRQIVADHAQIDMVIYNAGVTQIGAFSELTDATHRRVFDINYFAAAEMARHFLEPLRATKGMHLAVSSVAGFSPLYHRTAYAASKHALEGLFKTLRAEEAEFGVKVQIAAPSFVATNIGRPERQEDGIARPGSATDGVDYMLPEDAAKVIMKGLKSGKPMIAVGRVARLSWLINRLSPALFHKLMMRSVKK